MRKLFTLSVAATALLVSLSAAGGGWRGPGAGPGYPGYGVDGPGDDTGYSGYGIGRPDYGRGYPGSGTGYFGYGRGYPGYGLDYPDYGNSRPKAQGRGRPDDYTGGGPGYGDRGQRKGFGRAPGGHGAGPRQGPLNPFIKP